MTKVTDADWSNARAMIQATISKALPPDFHLMALRAANRPFVFSDARSKARHRASTLALASHASTWADPPDEESVRWTLISALHPDAAKKALADAVKARHHADAAKKAVTKARHA